MPLFQLKAALHTFQEHFQNWSKVVWRKHPDFAAADGKLLLVILTPVIAFIDKVD